MEGLWILWKNSKPSLTLIQNFYLRIKKISFRMNHCYMTWSKFAGFLCYHQIIFTYYKKECFDNKYIILVNTKRSVIPLKHACLHLIITTRPRLNSRTNLRDPTISVFTTTATHSTIHPLTSSLGIGFLSCIKRESMMLYQKAPLNVCEYNDYIHTHFSTILFIFSIYHFQKEMKRRKELWVYIFSKGY